MKATYQQKPVAIKYTVRDHKHLMIRIGTGGGGHRADLFLTRADLLSMLGKMEDRVDA